MSESQLDRHMARVMILKLLIMQAEHWTFDSDDRLTIQDRVLLRQTRDEYVEQLKGNLKFAERALQR